MSISHDELAAITVDTWQTLLGLDPEPSGQAPASEDVIYCATVHITGDTQWTIRVDCSGTHALDVTSAMFGMEPGEATDSDVDDALGEIANVIAGNVKAMMDGNSRLSLPTVAHGRGFAVTVPGMVDLHRASFVCEDQPVSVSILQQASKAATHVPTAALADA